MNDRERNLAIVVAIGACCIVAFFSYTWYASAVKARRDKIVEVEGKLEQEKRKVAQSKAAGRKLAEYESRSLPPQPAIARSEYQHWLLTKAQEAGLRDQVVSPTGQRPEGTTFVQQTFTVSGKGRYEQIVKLLDDIYRTDLLHRVSRMSIKSIKDSKDLDLSLTLDAVSVLSAPESKELITKESKRLKLTSAEKYQESIVGRNIFGPPNRAPRITGLGRQRAETNRSVDIVAKASDPDPLDLVKLELLKAPPGARLDPSGKLIWTPRQKGEYEFEIAARDDNFPPRVATEKLIVTVTDPPPPPPPVARETPPPMEVKLAFDNAKHTVLTAILGVGDEGEIWLLIRPTAELVKMHEGDSFEIGSIKGIVREIGDDDFVFESTAKDNRGKLLRVGRGDILEQATLQPIPTSTTARTDESEP